MIFRKDEKELKYYASDLNAYIGKFLPKVMTCVNIDCVLLKKKTKQIYMIEYKHDNEKMGKQQKDVLEILAKDFNKVSSEYKYGIFIIQSDPTFENAKIHDLIKNKIYYVDNCQLNSFLTFKEFKEKINVKSCCIANEK